MYSDINDSDSSSSELETQQEKESEGSETQLLKLNDQYDEESFNMSAQINS